MTSKKQRAAIVEFMNENEENFYKVYTYLNGNIAQCFTFEAEYIIDNENELDDEQVEELYNYILG